MSARRQYVLVRDHPSLNPSSALTLALWVKADDWRGNRRLLQKGGDDEQYRLLVENGRMTFQVGRTALRIAGLPATRRWVHVAATYDGAMLRLYFDGVLRGEMPRMGPIPIDRSPLFIGTKGRVRVQGDYFDGVIDDVRIYGRALSAAELRGL